VADPHHCTTVTVTTDGEAEPGVLRLPVGRADTTGCFSTKPCSVHSFARLASTARRPRFVEPNQGSMRAENVGSKGDS